MSAFLSVRQLSKRFSGIDAVNAIDFDLHEREMLALIGPNGAGKTTCFNMLMGQLKPDSGSIRLQGTELVGLATRQIWRLGVGRTFQITATYPSMTVRENIQMALLSDHGHTFRIWGSARAQYRSKADALLERVGMAVQGDRPAAELAYGDLKRLELAIALAHSPRLLLMDEPTAGTAAEERQVLMQTTTEIVQERGISVLFTEHDMDVVFSHAHRVLVLNRGEIIADGSVSDIQNNPLVKEIYLGGGSIKTAADS